MTNRRSMPSRASHVQRALNKSDALEVRLAGNLWRRFSSNANRHVMLLKSGENAVATSRCRRLSGSSSASTSPNPPSTASPSSPSSKLPRRIEVLARSDRVDTVSLGRAERLESIRRELPRSTPLRRPGLPILCANPSGGLSGHCCRNTHTAPLHTVRRTQGTRP